MAKLCLAFSELFRREAEEERDVEKAAAVDGYWWILSW